ncbi:MAG: hypothetical protein CMJ39_03415 [Phycisphaerae bacterium]|nr:hypothetical protein [Phycisphaerae bacterium]
MIQNIISISAAAGISLLSGYSLATTPPTPGHKMPDHMIQCSKDCQVSLHTPGGWRGKALRAKEVRQGTRSGPRGLSGVLEVPVLCFGYQNVNLPANTVPNLQQQLFDGPWPTGTLTEYWKEVSYGAFTFDGTVYDVGNLSQIDTYYEENNNGRSPDRIVDYITESVTAIDNAVDFGIYDNDGPDGEPNSGDDDGIVDLLALVHPEIGGEVNPPTHKNIWSHRSSFDWATGGTMLETNDDAAGGGKIRINDYVIQPAIGDSGGLIEIGVFCHEFGHAIGLPDLYDRDQSSEGIGDHCLMSSGGWNSPESPAHLSAWCRVEMGWVEPTVAIGSYLGYQLPNIEQFPVALKVINDPDGIEYFLIENRQPIGFDQNLLDCGLAIWHIDPRVGNSINDKEWCTGGGLPLNYRVALEQEDGLCNLENDDNRGDNGDFWHRDGGASPKFDSGSNPNSMTYDGDDMGVLIQNLSDCNNTMVFDIEVDPLPIQEPRKLDVLFIFDASGSYEDDLPNMLGQLPSVIDDIQARFPDPRFGIGSFRDFPIEPNGEEDDWAWRLDLDLTTDEPSVLNALSNIQAAGGDDVPESQFIAVHQALAGNGVDLNGDGIFGNTPGELEPDPVSWDPTRAPIIFLMTDAPFHDTSLEDYPFGPEAETTIGWGDVLNQIQVPTGAHSSPRIFTLNPEPDGIILTPGNDGETPWDPDMLYLQATEMALYSNGSMISAGYESVHFREAVQEALDLLATQMPQIGSCCTDDQTCVEGVILDDCLYLLDGHFAPGTTACSSDCNDNGKPDGCEISMGLVDDMNGNQIPDECECLGDSNLDGKIDIDDLLKLLGYWGACEGCTDVDLNGDGRVDIEDLLRLLELWGDCPNTSGCAVGEIEDCFGNCAPATWLGDATCDDGEYEYNGFLIDFNCVEFAFDDGDCVDCNENEIPDCFGNCCPATWIGDGFCDDGSDIYNGNFIFLNCEAYDWDGGDCEP